MYSAILVIGAIVIYLFHSKCMGLGDADMSRNVPHGLDPQHQFPCLPKDSSQHHYREIKQSAERLDAVTKYFTEHMMHDEKNNTSLDVWLELIDIQQTLREIYTNTSHIRHYSTTTNASDIGAPLILDYARIFLPYNLQGAIIEQVSNGTLDDLRHDNDTREPAFEAVRDTVLVLVKNVDHLHKEVSEYRKSQYDHLQAVSGDILKLYENARSQNHTAEQMKSAQAKLMEDLAEEADDKDTTSSAITDLRATVARLQQAFDEEFLQLLKNVTLMDERVALVEEENHDGFYAHEDVDDEWGKESQWASVLEKRLAANQRNIDVSDSSDNQSVSLNSTSDLQVIQNQIDFVSQELEQVIHHVEGRLAEFGGKVNSMERKILSANGLKEDITSM